MFGTRSRGFHYRQARPRGSSHDFRLRAETEGTWVEGDDTLRVDAAIEGHVAPIDADVPIATVPEPPNRIDERPPEVPS